MLASDSPARTAFPPPGEAVDTVMYGDDGHVPGFHLTRTPAVSPPGGSPRCCTVQVPGRVVIDNHASNTHTVLDLNGRDWPGLLHDMTAVLSEQGCRSPQPISPPAPCGRWTCSG